MLHDSHFLRSLKLCRVVFKWDVVTQRLNHRLRGMLAYSYDKTASDSYKAADLYLSIIIVHYYYYLISTDVIKAYLQLVSTSVE